MKQANDLYGGGRRGMAAAAIWIVLLPGATYPIRFWESTQKAAVEITRQAVHCYDTVKFVYRLQHQSATIKRAE